MLGSINNNSFIIPPAPLGQRKVADGPREEQMLVLSNPECTGHIALGLWRGRRNMVQSPVSLKTNKQRKTQATNLEWVRVRSATEASKRTLADLSYGR